MQSSDEKKWYNLSVVVQTGEDRFQVIKKVYLCPAYIIVNRLEHDLHVLGSREASFSTISAGVSSPFHFDPEFMRTIRLALSGENWSANLDFSSVGRMYCRCFAGEEEEEVLLKVELILEDGTCFVFVDESKVWPFVVDNQSDFPVSFAQTGVSNPQIRTVSPNDSVSYSWDDPSMKSRSIDLLICNRRREINPNELGIRPPMSFRISPDSPKQFVIVDVSASGPVICVTVKNYDAERASFRVKSSTGADDIKGKDRSKSSPPLSTADSQIAEYEVVEVAEEVASVTVIRFPFVGLSIIRTDNKEFLYLSCRDVELRLSQSNLYFTYGLSVKSIQLDNQMFDWQIPIVLYPADAHLSFNHQQHEQNHIRIALIKSLDKSHGIDCYSYFGFLMQETVIEIGSDIYLRLMDFLSFEDAARPLTNLVADSDLQLPESSQQDPSKDEVYFELFQIHPIRLTVSSSRTEVMVDSFEQTQQMSALQEAAFSTFANFSQAPLVFNALILEHPIVSLSRLQQLVIDHYRSGFFMQFGKLLGSFDLIFNPVGLFNNLGSGFSDLFYEPYLGFVSDRPQDIGIGLVKGGFSLVRKTVFGLTDSLSKFTGSIGKGLSALTFDKSFQYRRRLDRARNRPRHAVVGVVTGARQFIEGVAGGIGGLVEKPLEGAKEDGAEGFFKGIAIGVVGMFSKPFVGAVDMVTSVTEGIRNSADPSVQDLSQIRLARLIPFDGIIRRFKEREARGQSLLYNCIGQALFEEFYMGHLEDEDGSALFITCKRVIAARLRSGRTIWELSYSRVQSVKSDSGYIVFSLNDRMEKKIACGKKDVQNWFVARANLAISVYNDVNRI